MRSLVIAFTVALVAVALVSQTVALSDVMTGEDVPLVTDLDRDLAGAEALNQGLQPYTTLGELKPGLPPEWAELWVAHSPVSMVTARALLGLSEDQSKAVDIYRWVSVAAVVGLASLLLRWGSRDRLLVLAAVVVAVWAPTISDLRWAQGQALVALGAVAVLTLYSGRHRAWALALLGMLVAWKPWLIFLALFLPGSSTPWKDGSKVALISTMLTVAVLPWSGGWLALRSWLLEAVPSNTELSREIHTGVLSLTAQLSVTTALVIYGAVVVIAVMLGRRTLDPQAWPALGALTHLGYGALVWDHYWLALLPVICWPLIRQTAEPMIRKSVGAWLVLSAFSHPVHSAIDWPGWIDFLALAFLASVPVGLGGLWWSAFRETRIKTSRLDMDGVAPVEAVV